MQFCLFAWLYVPTHTHTQYLTCLAHLHFCSFIEINRVFLHSNLMPNTCSSIVSYIITLITAHAINYCSQTNLDITSSFFTRERICISKDVIRNFALCSKNYVKMKDKCVQRHFLKSILWDILFCKCILLKALGTLFDKFILGIDGSTHIENTIHHSITFST